MPFFSLFSKICRRNVTKDKSPILFVHYNLHTIRNFVLNSLSIVSSAHPQDGSLFHKLLVNFTATYLLRSHVDILIIFLDEQQEDDIGGARSTHGGVEHFFKIFYSKNLRETTASKTFL